MENADNPQLSPKKEKEFLQTALARFKLASDAEQQSREKALEADKFSTGEQWPDTIRTGRETGPNPRPCLTIDKTDPAIRQVVNDARQNRPQSKIIPSDDGSTKTAKILEGMLRFIQVGSNSDVAVDTAFDQMVRGGWGYMRVLTDYCDKKSFNQEIKIKPVRNRFTVYPDPFCMEPDYSDARFYFVIDDIPTDEFKKQYKKAEINTIDFSSLGDNAAGWKDSKTTRIAEYWVREEVVDYCLYEWPNGTVSKEPPPAPQEAKRERDVMKSKVTQYKITATDILETNEWAGQYIPIIPVLGEDHDIDGKRKLRGMVTQMMDPQRMYNYMSSAMIEAIALAPKSPWLVAAGQIEGFENIWAQANTANFSHLPYNATDTNGTLHPAPSRNQAEPPIQAMAMATRQAAEDMQAVSGQFDPSLGKANGDQSGKAISNLQRQGSVSTFHFVDNLSRSLRYLGVVCLDLIPKIYDSHRIVRIVHEDGSHEMQEVNQHLKPGYAPVLQGQDLKQAMEEIFDVTQLKYDVVVSTGPGYTTKRQEALESMVNISQAMPEIWHVAGDLMAKNMDWPGADALADRLKKLLPPQLQDNQGQPNPQQLMQQVQQSGQMIDALSRALHAAHDKLDGKQAELQSREKIAEMNNETNLSIAQINAIAKEMGNSLSLFKEELAHLRGQKQLDQNDAQFAAQHSLNVQQAGQQADQFQQQHDLTTQAQEAAQQQAAQQPDSQP